jgi:phage terminase large subunit-like protein
MTTTTPPKRGRPSKSSLPREIAELDPVRREIALTREVVRRAQASRLEGSLAEFTKAAWHIIEPGTDLLWNWHLDVLCAYLEAFFTGRIKRLILNVPPGSLKSVLFSVMGPAWKWALDPTSRMINITNEIGLASRDNRRMRDVIESDWYKELWGHKYKLSEDQQEKLLFENTKKGFRQGLGITGQITGKRGSILLIDDPVDAKKAFSEVIIQSANNAYDQAVSSRLNEPRTDSIGLIMHRLSVDDMTGHLMEKKATKWVQVRIAMEYEGEPGYDPIKDLGAGLALEEARVRYGHLVDPRKKEGELMFPERFDREVVDAMIEDLGEYGAAGQLQQRPSPLVGGIIKSAYWKVLPDDQPAPKILHAFASWDTAFSEDDLKNGAYSACTVWGVWLDVKDVSKLHPEGRHKLILLSVWWGRVGFDELLEKAREIESVKLTKDYDAHVIEKKASGISMIQSMRKKSAVRILSYDPKIDGGGDKVFRAQMARLAFTGGLVWRPNKPWAENVAKLVASFPAGNVLSRDITDSVTQAVNFLVKGFWVQHPDDELNVKAPDAVKRAAEAFDIGGEDEDVPRVGGSGFYG